MNNLENVQGRLKNFAERVRPTWLVTRRIAIVLVSMTFGFYVHTVYADIANRPKCKGPSASPIKLLKQTSVAINERNELMIIDRATGTYDTYDASVGRTIFTLYANQIYSKTK
jgi:hypothetical protein